ncbi:MAG: tetratricopeptide repeat protein [Gallionella sp.]|nr:tetratricopeptide repeat protein [Gallionella sp.]
MNRLLQLAVMSLFAVHAWSANAVPQSAAEIVSLQGKGEFREPADSAWRNAAVRQQLARGDFVRTGDASRMGVLLADQTQIRLAANSMMQIKQLGDNRDRGTILKQSAGRSWTQSKNINAPAAFIQSMADKTPNKLIVETPSAVAAIRGTDWEMVVDEDGTSTMTVLSGVVLLSNEQGSVSVGVGEQGQAKIGVAPVKRILQNPRDRVQWVSSFTVDPRRYPELDGAKNEALKTIGDLLRAGDFSAARRAVDRLVAQQPATGTAQLLFADFQVMEGEIEAAIGTLRQGATRYPDDERFDVWRARLHLIRDEIGEARSALAAARGRNPRSAEMMIAEGELERFDGRAQAATDAYRSALATAPESARAWHGLGVIQSEREEVADARVSLNKAISLDPQGEGFRGELGTLEAFADDLAAARAAFTRAIEDRPDDYVALTGLGFVELKSGNTDAAITRLLAATLIEPRYARAQTYLAIAYYQQGRIHDALFALSRARELDAKDPLPDMFESLIRNDLLQPGDALVTARRALTLLPYLKSLNQIANDQKGSANLGSALAAFGLEDWARSYAQDSYYPFWAGSHLFLADRYAGDFNKKSELFQGFLADPTVFGASNRHSTLIARPGAYLNIGARHSSSRDFSMTEPTITANGYVNSGVPFAWFAEVIRTDTRPDQVMFDAAANTYTLALGARPTYELGLFAYANAFEAKFALSPSSGVEKRVNGSNERLDLGAHYRFGPQSQAWLKIGTGDESSTVDTVTSVATNLGTASNGSKFATRPDQRDIQLRHTFAVNDQHELSWGTELGLMKKTNTQISEKCIHIESSIVPCSITGSGIVPLDRLNQRDSDRSRDLWLSDRYRVNDGFNLQGDLAWQHYTKSRDINIDRDAYVDYPNGYNSQKQQFSENYDRSFIAPRLGASYVIGNGATLRGAYQKWLRPASYNSLVPVATAGIPIDDSLVYSGGTLSRFRGQLDWELSSEWFMSAFADRKRVDNLSSPLDGTLNTRADVTNLERLRQQSVANLAAPDQIEATPIFARGNATSGGIAVNHVLSRNLAGYFGYANTHSENTGTVNQGTDIPYLPKHRATLGMTWAGDQRTIVSAQTVWRSTRFADEANLTPLASGWDMTLKLHWESEDKRWNLEGYAANLLNRDVEDLLGVSLIVRF